MSHCVLYAGLKLRELFAKKTYIRYIHVTYNAALYAAVVACALNRILDSVYYALQ